MAACDQCNRYVEQLAFWMNSSERYEKESSAKDAEIARLRTEVEAERSKRSSAEAAYALLSTRYTVASLELERTERDLAAARAALAKEREALAEAATIIRTRHGDKYHERNAAHFLARYDARRAAEAKEKP